MARRTMGKRRSSDSPRSRDRRSDTRRNDRDFDREPKKPGAWKSLREETRNSIIGILLLLVAVILALAAFGSGGYVGGNAYRAGHFVFGVGYWLLPLLFVLLGVNFFRASNRNLAGPALWASPFFVLSALGILSLPSQDATSTDALGGFIGYWVMRPVVLGLGPVPGAITLITILLASILVLFDTPLRLGFMRPLVRLFRPTQTEEELAVEDTTPALVGDIATADAVVTSVEAIPSVPTPDAKMSEQETDDRKKAADIDEGDPLDALGTRESAKGRSKGKSEDAFRFNPLLHEAYTPPPIDLLAPDRGKPGVGDIKANTNIIKRTLANFGIEVEMDEVLPGPSFTRYSLKPAEGVRVSKITTLQHDLELALAAAPIRIEAPIPGKSLVGLEMPNAIKSTVGLASLLSSPAFAESHAELFVPLGKSVSGVATFMNLAKMPHLLVAGTTGSGKSVVIHNIITSLLYRNSPEQLRFIMVDPKHVELTHYDGIPHLFTPVITEAKRAILALNHMIREMERRYEVLRETHCVDIHSYHTGIISPALEKEEKRRAEAKARGVDPDIEEGPEIPELMPYFVVVIDELADIMTAYPRELETAIVRLAQKARAVGIHLILSTQSPRVNVITGLIKANIPARIALRVISQIDSRTILDGGGAENLLGSGDMLFLSGETPKPVRLQSAFISSTEVDSVVKFLKKTYLGTAGDEMNLTPSEDGMTPLSQMPDDVFSEDIDGEGGDPKYEEAKRLIIESGKASTSLLQRKLGIGYGRAAKIVDRLEEEGIVGAADGSKAREVLVGREGM